MENTTKEKRLQWHPAFYAGIQIEFEEEADKLIFENEHNLSTKPLQIDVLVIKKSTGEKILKNIGRIFRTYNIVEYKSPDDYLSIDDYYKVYAYTYLYKSDTGKANEIALEELTMTMVCSHYPRKLIKHLRKRRKLEIVKYSSGIYYIKGEVFPVQLIVTSRLSKEENLWLKSLTNNLTRTEAEELVCAYDGHAKENLYASMMDVIVRANEEGFREAKNMCDALLELMKDELDASREEGKELGKEIGKQELLFEIVSKKVLRGSSLEQIVDELEIEEQIILPLYNKALEKQRIK